RRGSSERILGEPRNALCMRTRSGASNPCAGIVMSHTTHHPASRSRRADAKRPFDIALAIDRLRDAVEPLPKAAMFQLAEEGYQSVFELLVACMISIRTRDETTVPVARRLFARARTPI